MSFEEGVPGKRLLRGVGLHLGHVTREDDVGAPGVLGVQLLPVAVRALGQGHGHGSAIVHLMNQRTYIYFSQK